MSVWRTTHPGDTLTVVPADGSPAFAIGYGGIAVPDALDSQVTATAASVRIEVVRASAVAPQADTLTQQVQLISQKLDTLPVPLAEQPLISATGPAWAPARSGQTVPVSMFGAGALRTLTLEPGGTGSRVAVRLDAASADGYALRLVGSGGDVVPVVDLVTAGAFVVLEGIKGGGGWRVVNRYDSVAGTVSWAQVTGKPSIPASFGDLSGSVADSQVPTTIARTASVTTVSNALGGKSDTGHTHGGFAASGHTHPGYAPLSTPVVEIRLTADYTGLSGNTWYVLRGQMGLPGAVGTWDPYSMFTQPGGSGQPYQLVIPDGWGGRYDFLWQAAADGNAYNPLILVGLLNSPDTVSGTEFTSYIAFRDQSAGMGGCSGSARLAAGDKVGIAVFCGQSGTWNLRTVLSGLFRTKAVLAYRGP